MCMKRMSVSQPRRLGALRARTWIIACLAILVIASSGVRTAQSEFHSAFDHVLDTYVRDGYVYYLALQKDRAALDRYVASLDLPRQRIDAWSRPEQQAFWVNAYNAIVLKTVIDAYPIRSRSSQYPAKSVRQIPGAFDAIKHRVGGQTVTLDEIEKNEIVKFGDARL